MRTSLVILVCCVLLGAARADGASLLENGDFEDGLGDWIVLKNSGRATMDPDSKVKKHGRQSLHIAKTGGVPFDVLRKNIKSVTPGTRLDVSAWFQGKDVGNAFFKFWVYDAAGEPVVEDVDVAQLRGTFQWKKVQKTYDLPASAASAAVMVLMVLGGDLWIDDIRVEGAAPEVVQELDAKTRSWLDESALPIASLDVDAPFDDLMPLKELWKDVRIVQLGEASHGDGPTFRAKARLAIFLHREMGFDVLAFEAGLFECDRTNEMLAEGKVREAMFASVPGVWRVGETRPLFQYLADQAQTERPFRLAGWDLQSTGGMALERPARFAAFLGDDAALPEEAQARMRAATEAMWEGKYAPTSAERKTLAADLGRIEKAIEEKRDALVAKHGEREVLFFERALDDYRRGTDLHLMPEKGQWHKLNLRDGRMADNLRWLAEVYYPDAKIVVWGATMHLMHGSQGIFENRKAFYKGCKPMGDQTWKTFKKQVYTVGFGAYDGRKGTPFWGPFDIDMAPTDSIEGVLHRYGKPLLFVDLRKRGPFHKKLQAGPLGYSRAMIAKWPSVIDGFFFTDSNRPSTYVGD